MNKLEVVEALRKALLKKEQIENLKHDVDDYYCDEVHIFPQLVTKAFQNKRKFEEGSIETNKQAFIRYLNVEIAELDVFIQKAIGELGVCE